MQLNIIIKWLVIILPMTVITACSLARESIYNRSSKDLLNRSNAIDIYDRSNFVSEDLANLQLQRNRTVYFDLNKYDINSNFIAILDAHARFLRVNPTYKVTIEGHTDERGTPEYNISLGENRANAVKTYLQNRGVSIDQISIISYGEEKPAATGHNEASYAKNRRAVLLY